MGKANRGGQKRKEAPARKQLQGRGGNSGLLHKNNHRQQNGGAHHAAGLDEGGAAMGKRTLAQQLLQPNKRARGGKRRRKAEGPRSKPGSSETAVIQAEYAAVDAREKAKADAEKARRLRAPARIKLAPSTSTLRMPSEGDVSMASLRASSSARMVEALLQSITDDPAPDAPPSRPVRSAGRKRRGNPYAALAFGDDDDGDESDNSGSDHGQSGSKEPPLSRAKFAQGAIAFPAGSSAVFGASSTGGDGSLAFASSSSFPGFSGGGGGGGGGGGSGGSDLAATIAVSSRSAGASMAIGARRTEAAAVTSVHDRDHNDDDTDDDPDL
ncbi:unnamed protein product [Hapterophycus canaliculatus]